MSTEETNPEQVREEHFEDQATGVEVEDAGHVVSPEKKPWDPERIRIHTKHFSVRQIVDQIQEGDLDLAPDFQRLFVWKDWQQWSLIESILLGIPLPSFYFNELDDGRLQVVDGVQRLTTIFSYVGQQSFALGTVDYLRELEGRYFDDLDASFRRRVSNTQIVVHVIDPQTPFKVKFDIFRRINTGGSALSAQEIRHCMSKDRSRQFLKRLVHTDEFQHATGGSLLDHVRMADREVALRFCAFRLYLPSDYAKFDSLDDFLISVTADLDDGGLSDERLDALHNAFVRGMAHAKAVFGDHAFRKWANDQEHRNPINRALVETWGTLLADRDTAALAAHNDEIVERARELMTTDAEFLAAISSGTGDHRKVTTRFEKVRTLLDQVLS